jgi:hypothetical protein
MIELVRTNVPGFSKNKKSNVLINTDTNKIASFKEERQKLKRLQFMQDQINMLEKRLTALESRYCDKGH